MHIKSLLLASAVALVVLPIAGAFADHLTTPDFRWCRTHTIFGAPLTEEQVLRQFCPPWGPLVTENGGAAAVELVVLPPTDPVDPVEPPDDDDDDHGHGGGHGGHGGDDDHDNGHGNDDDHDDDSNPGNGGGHGGGRGH